MFWQKKSNSKIITDSDKIDLLIERGVEAVFPNKDFLRSLLKSGKRIKIYYGIDPTATSLHVGSSVSLIKLRMFQDLGHEVIMLIGDFTGMIGDPTDKSATRKKLTKEEVLNNCKLYVDQASKILNFTGENPVTVKYNSEWLAKLNFGEILELSSLITVEQMLKRDMFDKRMKEGKPIYLHEFMYPLMQGYDSVAMDVDGEIGGNDQTFNMLVGRDLMKVLSKKDKFVLTMKLMTDASGKKMGKTDGNAVFLDQSSKDMFGKIMSWNDGLIIPSLELCTFMDLKDIEKIKQELSSGKNPKDYKVILAKEIVSIYHGKDVAEKEAKEFDKIFSKGSLPTDIPLIKIERPAPLSDILVKNGLCYSKAEFRRLLDEGAISEFGKEAIKDPHFIIEKEGVWRIGKKRFVEIKI